MTYDFARYLNIRSAIMPVVSPDGARVAYLTDVTGNYQVWSVGVAGDGWPRQLTFFADKVWEVHGTSAAQHLVAVGDVGGNERQQFYLVTNYGVDAAGRLIHDVRRLTEDDSAIHRFGAFSADGQQIVYTSNARNRVDFDTYILDVGSGASRLLHHGAGNRTVLAWSPDGRYVLIVDEVSTLQNELYVLDVESAAERHLTAGLPSARYHDAHWTECGLYLLTDRDHDRFALCRIDLATAELTTILDADFDGGTAELEWLAVGDDGRQAALTVNDGGYSRLYRVDLQSGAWHAVDGLPAGVIANLKIAPAGDVAFDLQAPDRPLDVWLDPAGDAPPRPITNGDRAGIDAATFVEPALARYTTFDERQIPAFFYVPQQEAPAQGYPCILYVHGGPASQQRPDFDVRFQFFLSRGYALMVPNVRGSIGYGRAYTALDDVELRMDSVADLQAAVQWLHMRPEIDPQRIAIYGRSYGGFMVLAALTEYPELFAVGVEEVGIANWVTFLERTGAWRRSHREREYGSLAEHRDLLERISPIHKVERIRAPLLVLAGDNDPRVPLFESEQVAARVQAAGGRVRFIHYADEGHKFSKLANRIDSFTQIGEFLAEELC